MSQNENNPWKTLSSRVVYKNPWITVREDQVVRPDGKPGIYGVVEPRLAIGIVAMTPNREIYLVGQYRYPVNCYSWEIVEGGVDDDLGALATAKKELREEAGLVAGKFEQLGGESHLSNCFSSERALYYLATELEEVEAEPEGTEVLKIRKVPLKECLRMLDAGEFQDAMTEIALSRVARLLKV